MYEGMSRNTRSWALAALGRPEDEPAVPEPGPGGLAALRAELWARTGDLVTALRILTEDEGAQTGAETHRADTLRCRAELLAQTGAAEREVESIYRDSLAWARRQGALSYELRTSTSYARFLRDHARAAEASELLAPVYARFTEGFDTRDLVEAKAMLEELGA